MRREKKGAIEEYRAESQAVSELIPQGSGCPRNVHVPEATAESAQLSPGWALQAGICITRAYREAAAEAQQPGRDVEGFVAAVTPFCIAKHTRKLGNTARKGDFWSDLGPAKWLEKQ
ncbi:hypothetical protein llap_255 [Limosa lapponica baueri]|uniref:Uncharacterized protein n=1 Tax=Limosa lapponica baueri TaxID=1758121 RepID=A0A2I0UTN4_LIMLA|nr:hypothetical protein llap_255 [Limosa lapponica baueri]